MSAWIVQKEHIDVVVASIKKFANYPNHDETELGKLLWGECWLSIAYRYPHYADGDRPGPTGFKRDDIKTYVFENPGFDITPGEAACALGCYDYQTCEHPEYGDSLAYKIITTTKSELGDVHYEGPWGWGEKDIEERRNGAPAVAL